MDDFTRIRHIIAASEKAFEITHGLKRSDIEQDNVLGLALIRLLEIIGEAAAGLSEQTRNNHPEIAWRQMSGMRNRLIHGYFDIDLDTVWETVTTQLPPLIPKLQKLLDKETKKHHSALWTGL